MGKLLLLFFFVLYTQDIHCEVEEWGYISEVPLEKGKPITLDKPYTRLAISRLNGTIYADTLSKLEGIVELRIYNSNIVGIEPGALCSAPNVKKLDFGLYGGEKTPILTKDHFKNCSIEELTLTFNYNEKTYKLNNDVLENLSTLKKLNLDQYNLGRLDKNFLKLPHNSLTGLTFMSDGIKEVDPDTFDDLKDLEEIGISYNRELKSIPKGLFKNNPKLKKLNLALNNLENLTWDEFEGISNLETLFLFSNKLVSFDAKKIAKNMPNLKNIDIAVNPITCEEKSDFAKELRELVNDVKVNYMYDLDCAPRN